MPVKLGIQSSAKSKAMVALDKFLQDNPLAKIVIILDTHSAQDGQIISKVVRATVSTDILGKARLKYPRTSG